MSEGPPRILIIRRRYLGDVVLLGPFLQTLRRHWPQARLTVLVDPRFAGILEVNRTVDEVIPYRGNGLGAMVSLWRKLRSERFTHLFDLDCSDRSALVSVLSGANHKSRLEIRPRYSRLYNENYVVPRADFERQHTSETYLSLLTHAGISSLDRTCRLVPREEDLSSVRELFPTLRSKPRPVLAIHPGSRSAFRIWPSDRFAAVVDRIQHDRVVDVLLLGDVKEAPLLAEIRTFAKTPVMTSPRALSLPELAAVFSLCDTVLCHDSGPMHVAAAVGTPLVALFGSQAIAQWRPLGEQHLVLQAPLPCHDCVAPSICVPDDSYKNYCVRRLSVEQVFGSVAQQLRSQEIRDKR